MPWEASTARQDKTLKLETPLDIFFNIFSLSLSLSLSLYIFIPPENLARRCAWVFRECMLDVFTFGGTWGRPLRCQLVLAWYRTMVPCRVAAKFRFEQIEADIFGFLSCCWRIMQFVSICTFPKPLFAFICCDIFYWGSPGDTSLQAAFQLKTWPSWSPEIPAPSAVRPQVAPLCCHCREMPSHGNSRCPLERR